MAFHKPNKSAIVLTVSKEETRENLKLLRSEFDAAEACMLNLVKRLQWFRDWQAYKHLGYSTFTQFVKHECGKSRKWMWEQFKALPVRQQEKELSAECPPGGHGPNKKPSEGDENADDVKIDKPAELSHKQRLEVSKLNPMARKKVLEVLLEKHAGADIETTRTVIAETLGRAPKTPSKPKTDPQMEAAFGPTPAATEARDRIKKLATDIAASARNDSDAQLSNVVESSMDAFRWAIKRLKK